MIKEFQFDFEELNISITDIEELMGFEDGVVPEPLPELIQQAVKETPDKCNIKGGFKVFNSIKVNQQSLSIKIDKIEFNPSKTVITQFKDANSFALFLCTAGREISDYAKEVSTSTDPLLGYVFDVLGSVIVEKACDKIQDSLKKECQKLGLGITDRFSPGYCEWSVGEQQQLFSLMPEKFCGITLSDSSLMSPIKSVSGIIGVGKGMQQKGYQCNWCTDTNCLYGKIKRNKNVLKK